MSIIIISSFHRDFYFIFSVVVVSFIQCYSFWVVFKTFAVYIDCNIYLIRLCTMHWYWLKIFFHIFSGRQQNPKTEQEYNSFIKFNVGFFCSFSNMFYDFCKCVCDFCFVFWFSMCWVGNFNDRIEKSFFFHLNKKKGSFNISYETNRKFFLPLTQLFIFILFGPHIWLEQYIIEINHCKA